MRPVLAVLFFLIINELSASELTLVRVWPSYRSAESFIHVSEFFTGKEATRGENILRSQPEARGGFYFLTRIKNSGPALADARIEIQMIFPDSPLPKTYRFASEVRPGNHVLEIGLTGKDWPSPSTQPVAWKLRITRPDGTELATEQSFVWALPEKKR